MYVLKEHLMIRDKKHIDELISACLAGQLDRASQQELDAWADAAPENGRYFEHRQQEWFAAISEQQKAVFDKDRAFTRFLEKTEESCERIHPATNPPRQFRLSRIWKYAAAVAIAVIIAVFSYRKGEQKVVSHYTDMVIDVPLGSRTELQLPDGSTVCLNGRSHISYSQGFGIHDRSLTMTGEGYFEVQHNEELPFLVNTPNLSLQVIGTKFNFRDYTDDKEAIVSLLEGKVNLCNLLRKEEITLSPNERAVLDKKSGKMTHERTVATNAIQWTNGYLFFDEELLPDIVKELERSYNVRIQIANEELNHIKFYGNFIRREQTIQEVLDILSATGKINYRQKDSVIILY